MHQMDSKNFIIMALQKIKPPHYKRFIYSFILLVLTSANSWAKDQKFATDKNTNEEPIRVVGHGALIGPHGKLIKPSIEFISNAQAWYQRALIKHLSDEDNAKYKQLERKLFYKMKPSDPEVLVLKHKLMEWAIKRSAKNSETQNITIKLRALNHSAKNKMLKKNKIGKTFFSKTRKIHDFLDRLNRDGRPEISILKATLNSGQAYINECSNAGVPIPPPINQMDPTGLTGWRSDGFIPDSDNMLLIEFGNGGNAELRSYRSAMPAGMCYSLPRYSNSLLNSISLDGVICLSETTSRACFWDNQWTNPETNSVEKFNIAPNEIVPIGVPTTPGGKYQAGGLELENASGGQCTDCHAGENPFIVHPESVLASTANGGIPIQVWEDLATPTGDLDHFSTNRYVPLVAATWPQNDASMQSTAIPATCNACHVKGSAGRLPHLSDKLPGYCDIVLRLAGQRTMPASPYTPSSENAAVNTLINDYCYEAPDADVADVGDPHITTVDGTRYDFQSAGEFTMLRALDDGFELQTRQTPVLTTFTPSANPHTGLASCPSLNTAAAIRAGKAVISYQPAEGALSSKEDLQLFINGEIIPEKDFIILGGGHSLDYKGPGKTLQVYLADGSSIKVEPKYWQSQGYWYLNIHVENTRAREGVMGLISKGNWLPRLPDHTSLGSKPASQNDRHDLLNIKFADAWRVSDKTSLFYYAPGTSTQDFTDPDWPAPPGGSCEKTQLQGDVPFVEKPQWELAKELCSKVEDKIIRADCILDVSVMGEVDAARVHWEADTAN